MKVCIKWFKTNMKQHLPPPPRHLMNRYPKWRHIWSQRYIKKIHHFLVFIPKFGTEVLASRAWNELNHAERSKLMDQSSFHHAAWTQRFLAEKKFCFIHSMVVQYPPRFTAPKMHPEGRSLAEAHLLQDASLEKLFLHFNLPPHRNPIQSFHFIVPPPDSPSNHDGTFTSSQTFKAIWNFQGSQLLLTNPNAAQHFLQCKSVKLIIYFSIKFDPHPEMGPIWATKKTFKNFSWLCWLFKRDPCHGLSLMPI